MDAVDRLPAAGDVLGGKYVVERLIAEGGMGAVFEARHARLGHRVAIKVLQPYTRIVPQIGDRFEREARAAAQIRSRNVARVIDVETLPDGSPFMVMELLDGHDLDAEIATRGTIPPVEAVNYALEACAGMAEAHRLGIVHRDLKPANLFLSIEDGERVLKVLDFGISKIMADVDLKMTSTNSVLGTPLYMSPEQVRSAKNVDARTDIWSLGIILYEMLSGTVPFLGETANAVAASIVADEAVPPASRCQGLPPGLSDVVMKALRKQPSERYQDIAELAAALQPFDGKSRRRPPMSVIQVTAGEVSVEARTVATPPSPAPQPEAAPGPLPTGPHVAPPAELPRSPEGSAERLASEEGPSSPLPRRRTAAPAERPPLAAVVGVPDGANRTAPGWTASPPERTRPRRAIVAGAVAAAILGLAAAARTLSSREALPATGDVGPQSMRAAATSSPTPLPLAESAAPPLITPALSASSPPADPGRAPQSPVVATAAPLATPRSATPPPSRPLRAPTAAPPAAPRAPAVGLPSHI